MAQRVDPEHGTAATGHGGDERAVERPGFPAAVGRRLSHRQAARLLRAAEQPYIEQAIQANYPTLLNIGCAEGYYAVGMARRMPHTTVMAFDLNSKAQETCAALAARNGVSDRISIGALFEPADFATYADQRVLVLCDIEGAERKLLDLEIAPALAGMDLIVESHECLVPGLTRQLIERFAPTHAITVVEHQVIGDRPRLFRDMLCRR